MNFLKNETTFADFGGKKFVFEKKHQTQQNVWEITFRLQIFFSTNHKLFYSAEFQIPDHLRANDISFCEAGETEMALVCAFVHLYVHHAHTPQIILNARAFCSTFMLVFN